MSIAAINWATHQRAGSPLSKLILMTLADLADGDHSWCIKVDRLAEVCECSRRAVQSNIRKLASDEREGGPLLKVQEIQGRASRYWLLVDGGAANAPQADQGGAGDSPGGAAGAQGGESDDIPPTPPHIDTPHYPPTTPPVITPHSPPADLAGIKSDIRSRPDLNGMPFAVAWWAAPVRARRRSSTAEAEVAFNAAVEAVGDPWEVVRAIKRYADTNPDPQYVPGLHRWLAKRWEAFLEDEEPQDVIERVTARSDGSGPISASDRHAVTEAALAPWLSGGGPGRDDAPHRGGLPRVASGPEDDLAAGGDDRHRGVTIDAGGDRPGDDRRAAVS